jgi:hypothetical protein
MDFKGNSSNDSIITIHGIGKDWGRLPHREPLYVKKIRDRRKEPVTYPSSRKGQEDSTDGQRRDTDKDKASSEGFEITI